MSEKGNVQPSPADPMMSAVQKQKKRSDEATMRAPAKRAKPRKDTTGKMERRTRTDAKSCVVHERATPEVPDDVRPRISVIADAAGPQAR